MQFFTTLLAEIFVGAAVFAHDANTAAMLPDFANIALQEKAGQILRNICGIDYRFFYALS
jgi:hypothetical protein